MKNHPVERCYKKARDEQAKGGSIPPSEDTKERAEVMMIAASKEEIEMLMSTTTGPSSLTINTFIADSGASCHMRNSTAGMYDLEDHVQMITVGNSESMLSKYKGKYRGTIIQQDGTYMDLVLTDVLYIPDLWLNLISLTRAIKQPGISLSSKGELLSLKFGKQEEMIFDKIYTTGSGQLLGVEIRPSADYANMVFLTECLMIYEDLHEKLGHPNEQVVKNTAKHYGIKMQEQQKKCVHCAMGKIKKLKFQKAWKTKPHLKEKE